MVKEKVISETAVQKDIMLDMSARGHRGFRNNVGLFKTIDGRRIKTGLGNGTSDVIGFTSIEVTPDMVGKRIAVFTAIEVKRADAGKRLSKKEKADYTQQQKFLEFIKKMGGIAGLAWTVEMSRNLTDNIQLPTFKD